MARLVLTGAPYNFWQEVQPEEKAMHAFGSRALKVAVFALMGACEAKEIAVLIPVEDF